LQQEIAPQIAATHLQDAVQLVLDLLRYVDVRVEVVVLKANIAAREEAGRVTRTVG